MRLRALLRLVRRLRRPGIVYCATRREVDTVYALLRRFGIPVHRYHGAMNATDRNAEQTALHALAPPIGDGRHQRLRPRHRQAGHPLHPALPGARLARAVRAGSGARRPRRQEVELHPARRSSGPEDPRSPAGPQPGAAGPALSAGRGARGLGPGGPQPIPGSPGAVGGARAAGHRGVARQDRGGGPDRGRRRGGPGDLQNRHETIDEDVRSLAGQFETLRTQDGGASTPSRSTPANRSAAPSTCAATSARKPTEPCGLCDICRGRPARPDDFFAPFAPPRSPKKKKKKKARGRRPQGGEGRRGSEAQAPPRAAPEEGVGRRRARAAAAAADGAGGGERRRSPPPRVDVTGPGMPEAGGGALWERLRRPPAPRRLRRIGLVHRPRLPASSSPSTTAGC